MACYDRPVVVSLTSYPPRFPTLSFTIKSLINQKVRPNSLILWVTEADFAKLPENVIDLQQDGLVIRTCSDMKSYKKLIPALKEFSNSYIVTVDDDVYYEPNWLKALLEELDPKNNQIIAHRVHVAKFDEYGSALPYSSWEKDVNSDRDPIDREALFATGVGGVLYPPLGLCDEVFDYQKVRRLCPNADDVWFFWMSAKSGFTVKNTNYRFRLIHWPASQELGLHVENTQNGGNDIQLRMIQTEFGNYDACLAKARGKK